MFDPAAVPGPTRAGDLAELRLLGERLRPLTSAGERLLPVPEALADLLPGQGLVRGATAATAGAAATSLALGLAGPTTATGAWIAVVGLTELGLLAGHELGVDLARVLLVADPGPRAWGATVAALLDAVELVLVRPPGPVAPTVQRRLQARARERGSVLLQVGGPASRWAQAPDVLLTGSDPTWVGLGRGHGRLQARQLTVAVGGRRGADRGRSARLWLPAPAGGIAPVAVAPAAAPPASVTALREVG